MTIRKGLFRFLFLLVTLLPLGEGDAFAESTEGVQGVDVQWVQSLTTVDTTFWHFQTAWSWPEEPNSREGLRLRTSIWIPTTFRILKIEVDRPNVLKVRYGVPEVEGEESYSERLVAIDHVAFNPGARVTFHIQRVNSLKKYTAVLKFKANPPEPFFLTSPICEKLKASVKKVTGKARFLYMALRCQDYYDRLEFDVFVSDDAKWQERRFDELGDRYGSSDGYRYVVPKPKEELNDPGEVGLFKVVDRESHPSEYGIYLTPRTARQRFFLNAGVGGTYVSFQETLPSVTMTQWAVTGKIRAGYDLWPKVLIVDTSAFYTLAPFSVSISPDALGGARFYGINGRLGYELPIGLGTTRFQFLAGYYFWGMSVKDALYGVQSLSGPQVFVSMKRRRAGSRSFGLYGKVAPLIIPGNSLFSSYELAAGGSYQLTSPFSKTELMLTFDFSTMTIPVVSGLGPTSMSSYTVGLEMRIF